MNEVTSKASEHALWELMQTINACWYEKRVEELAPYFHDQIVFNSPDMKHQATGKAVCIQSYADFMENSAVLLYKETNPRVHLFGDTGIVTYDFEMKYEQKGKIFHETGTDIMVFHREQGAWKAVWRTLTNLNNKSYESRV